MKFPYCFSSTDFFSIVLLAVAGPNYKFIHAEVGVNGRMTDGGIWHDSEFNRAINEPSNPLNLPADSILLADGAFPLKTNLMKPYPGTRLTKEQQIFNKRLSRCRRIIENVFGQLIKTFQILERKLKMELDSCKRVTLVCCILHNFLKTVYSNDYEDKDEESGLIGQQHFAEEEEELSGRLDAAEQVRRNLCNYFVNVNPLPWQRREF